jgi:hypothetical protein
MFIFFRLCKTYVRIWTRSKSGGVVMSELEPLEYQTGAPILDYDIIDIKNTANGFEVLLNIN